MDKIQLAREIYQVSHLTGDFLLRSGQRSHEYFDKYRFESNPKILRQIAKELVSLLPAQFDLIAGLEMGGIPIATALSLETGIPAVFVRKKAKNYGTCKAAEGGEIRGKRLVIIEDIITTGGQVVLSAQDLRAAGAIVGPVLCVIDRSKSVNPDILNSGLELKSLFTAAQLAQAVK